MFGAIACNIPFIGSNQAPRNQFSCAQSKQAIGVYGTNYVNRFDTKINIMSYPQPMIY